MFDVFDDPGPCPVCQAPHCSCVGDRSSDGIGVTRGVIVVQLPARDATVASPAAAVTIDETPAPPARKSGVRPLRRPATLAPREKQA